MDFEKLGSFYLGRLKSEDESEGQLLLYDAKDLTTHALCVGMTGSGKTGLCIGLLEEAAIDNIPALVIDPKGDIGNLLLTFPELRPEDFQPWIDEAEAARKGMTSNEFAAATAKQWSRGLAEWGQDGARIAMLREAVDLAIYTPGSSAGLPISVLRSFSAPPAEQRGDLDALRERVLSTVSGILALLGMQADPIQSREHILLSNILDTAWREGTDLDMAELIRAILSPPFARLGVFDLESFYPEKDRRALAMQLNNVLASPGFAAWMQGETLDIGKLLHTGEGKPRISILSIAHLSDTERMFFVTLLLNEVVAWMRRQAGTSSLRAILYMDEIFGYFPPTANPPSKTPMLTLLKQARAFGVGCVLATQNPVDLDYKGLGNTGTWFIGRLQTERDKMRVLDGLEGASTSAGKHFDRATLDATLSGLGKRVFLMNNVHDDAPVLFETRWVLSYLRGPLTRAQIEILMEERKRALSGRAPASRISGVAGPEAGGGPETGEFNRRAVPSTASLETARPVLPADVGEKFFPRSRDAVDLRYRPRLFAEVRLHYVHARSKTDEWHTRTLLVPLPPDMEAPPWEEALRYGGDLPSLDEHAEDGATWEMPPAALGDARKRARWRKTLTDWLYRNEVMTLWHCPDLKELSVPGEEEGAFRVRLKELLHERRDLEMEKLRAKYLPRFSRVQERIRKAEQRVSDRKSRHRQQGIATATDIGATLLGALFGRRTSTAAAVRRTATRAGRVAGGRDSIARAEENLSAANEALVTLEDQFRDDALRIQSLDISTVSIEEVRVAPRKSDISLSPFGIVWMPWTVTEQGVPEALWEGSS